MVYLLGLALFFAVHTISLRRQFRATLTSRVGEKGFKGFYSIGSILGLTLVVLGWNQFPNVYFYEPPVWMKQINLALMLPALVFLVAAYIPNNLRRQIRHPMLTGVKIWAVGHVLANGDLRSLILFLSFLTFSVIDVIAVNRREQMRPERPRVSWGLDIVTGIVGVVVYMIIMMFHRHLFGVPVYQYLRLGS